MPAPAAIVRKLMRPPPWNPTAGLRVGTMARRRQNRGNLCVIAPHRNTGAPGTKRAGGRFPHHRPHQVRRRMEQQGWQGFVSAAAARFDPLTARVPDWAIGLAAIAVAVVAALACHAVLMRLARRFVDSREGFLKSLLAQTRAPTRLALLLLALS